MEAAAAAPAEGSDEVTAVFKKRAAKSKASFRKRAATPPPAAAGGDSSDYSTTDDEAGRRIKRRRKNAGVVAASTGGSKATAGLESTDIAADRSSAIGSTNDATKQSNWYDEDAKDALSAKNLLGTTRTKAPPGPSDGTYKGAAGYQSFVQKNPNAPSRQMGPVKAPTNIRTITVTDYAPDVCKDYKLTGFCGFGDSCKFLHAREDYKQGWELDRDWEVGTKGKKLRGQTVSSANRSGAATVDDDDGDDDNSAAEDAMLENIPFACVACKKPYKDPIVTRCGHYFCEACALRRYRTDPSCLVCGAGTGGVFNVAKNLKKLLDRKRDRARKRREMEREDGGDGVTDEEDDDGDGADDDDE